MTGWPLTSRDPRDTVGRLVEEIVRRSGLAEQTFKRRVAEAAGSLRRSNAYSASRVEGVKRRLKRTDASPDEVSWQVGYEDEAFFPRLFKRFTEMTPEAHRKRFRCPPSLHWAQRQHSIDLDQKSRTRMIYTGLHRVPDFEVASATRAEAASKFL